jgi:hypothetical protein
MESHVWRGVEERVRGMDDEVWTWGVIGKKNEKYQSSVCRERAGVREED